MDYYTGDLHTSTFSKVSVNRLSAPVGQIKLFCNIPCFVNDNLHSSLRHCATSRKVAGSIPDGVIGIFH